MGGRLFDWIGGGVSTSRPAAAGMGALLVSPGSTAFYFSTDTKILSVYDDSGPAWFDIDMTALSAFTTESLQDMIAAFLVAGSGMTLTYNDAGNQLSIICNITQYTDEMAQDTIAALIAAGTHTGITIAYNDAANTLSFTNTVTQYTNENAMDAIAAMLAAGSHTGITVTYNDAGDAMSLVCTVTQYTDEQAQDAIAAMLAAGTQSGISATYNDGANSMDLRNTRFMIPFFFTTTPTADELLAKYIATDAFTIPANFATPNSGGVIETNPTSSFVILVKRQVNATGAFTQIGTITISTGGAFTWATTGGVSIAIAANDVINFYAPHTPDATAANAAINVRGS